MSITDPNFKGWQEAWKHCFTGTLCAVYPRIISGGTVRSSVLSYNVTVRSWAEVDESVIMDNVEVGRHCRIKKAIIDKHNVIPPPTQIGINPLEDRKQFEVTPRGIIVVPKSYFGREA